VSTPTHERFAKLARETGRPMSQLVDEAVEALERRVFFDRLSSGFEALRGDPVVWSEVESERNAESGALHDHSS
jgi:hypothetical protein